MAFPNVQDPQAPSLPKPPVSLEAFLAWCDEDIHAEWVDEKVLIMSPASQIHQQLVVFLTVVLKFFTEEYGLGTVLNAPFSMRLGSVQSVREPDLLFVSTRHLDRLQETYLDGPADLAVEIVSKGSIGRDRGDKFVEYEQAGIPEYWLIDPERQQAEFYGLEADGRYHPMPLEGGVFRSAVLSGFWLRVDWLWADPLPKGLDVIRELGVLEG